MASLFRPLRDSTRTLMHWNLLPTGRRGVVFSAVWAGMKPNTIPENDILHFNRRHPVDFLEPLSSPDEKFERICEVLSRTFGTAATFGGSAAE